MQTAQDLRALDGKIRSSRSMGHSEFRMQHVNGCMHGSTHVPRAHTVMHHANPFPWHTHSLQHARAQNKHPCRLMCCFVAHACEK